MVSRLRPKKVTTLRNLGNLSYANLKERRRGKYGSWANPSASRRSASRHCTHSNLIFNHLAFFNPLPASDPSFASLLFLRRKLFCLSAIIQKPQSLFSCRYFNLHRLTLTQRRVAHFSVPRSAVPRLYPSIQDRMQNLSFRDLDEVPTDGQWHFKNAKPFQYRAE